MQVYLVGGAVRDKLLGLPIKDKDFVVVGATPQQMLDAGFLQVGADFPVFLHPTTKQEYALARLERKMGHGYQGFSVQASPEVTLEDDLKRRDLTINAMAIQVQGLFDDTPLTDAVIDPYGGLDDMANKKLRHISPAFSEDPLRVLRVARFYSRYYEMGFTIASDTQMLMQKLVATGELEHLSMERIWQESSRAMMQQSPQMYWQQLFVMNALQVGFSQLHKAWQSKTIRDTVQTALSFAGQLHLTLEQRWALLMASVDGTLFKDLTLPSCATQSSAIQNAPNTAALQAISHMGTTAKLPKNITQFAMVFTEHAQKLNNIMQLTEEQKIDLIQAISAHKHPKKLPQLLMTANVLQLAKHQQVMNMALDSHHCIGMKDIDKGLQGAQIGEALRQARIKHLQQRTV